MTSPDLLSGCSILIDGTWIKSSNTYERFDPSNLSRSTGKFSLAQSEHVTLAYEKAAVAQRKWSGLTAINRAEVLRKIADLLEAESEEAAKRLTLDMGKAIRDARGEVLRSVAILRYYSGELTQPSGETYPSADPSTFLMTLEEPLGVVCVITPWNFPFAIPVWKLAPSIAFGNTVVWKPADAATGSAVFLANLFTRAGLPPGVLNLITGKGSTLSASLTGNEYLSAISFTGSSAVGNQIRHAVADRNVKVQLELGGKNPAIVLTDADLDDAATQIIRGAMLSTGQRCTATSRVYIERGVFAEFTELLKLKNESLTVGDPFDEKTDVGPLGSVEQRTNVFRYIEIAISEKVKFITSVPLTTNDCFIAPTIITDVDSQSVLVKEEIFGPILILQEVENLSQAIDAANDTEFGLSSSLFTKDIASAMTFIKNTKSGIVHINRETAGVEPHVPFGGIKGSSNMHREQGKAARGFFTTTKTVYIRSNQNKAR